MDLDGKKFSRTLTDTGWFGQPKGDRDQVLEFEDGYLKDNANTFFGSPPTRLEYFLDGNNIMVVNEYTGVEEDSGYMVVDANTITNNACGTFKKIQ